MEYVSAPIRERGEITGGVLIFRDRTGTVEAERERERFEQRLRQSERLESLGRLAGGVAHDFNNLLAAMLSYASWLRATSRSRTPPCRYREIRRAAERAAALTQQLLVFSRGEEARRRSWI